MVYIDENGQVRIKSEGQHIIKIKKLNPNLPDHQIIEDGDWIDLYASVTKELKKDEVFYYPLGVGMILPDGFEGHLVVRSGTPKKNHIVQNNPEGIIDQTYCGEDTEKGTVDEWKLNCRALEDTVIEAGTRIAQFRIALSQKATAEQKWNDLQKSGVAIEFVDELKDKTRAK